MKNYITLLIFCLVIISCNSDLGLEAELPIVYSGIDTVYDYNDPKVDYYVNESRLEVFTFDSILLDISSMPIAPVDSPYGIHGSGMTYNGKLLEMDGEMAKIKWDFEPKKWLKCEKGKEPNIILWGDKTTSINLTEDTLCIGDVSCVRQKK
ncbi:MAG: hypothetical protein MK212_09215 [Saprospiraceae bacterium]|nr:hypothetical protein [Saprospiraceae bacterium]